MMGDAITHSPAEQRPAPAPTLLDLIAETARDHGWVRLPQLPSRVVWAKEVGDYYRRIEIAPDSTDTRPLQAIVLRRVAPEDSTVDFFDAELDDYQLTDAIRYALRAAP